MDDDIPPLRPPESLPPLRTQADVDRFWRMIKGPWGFDEPQIWLHVIDRDGASTGLLTTVTELPPVPDRLPLVSFVAACREALPDVLDSGGMLSFLFARPGSDPMDDDDRCWARHILEACEAEEVPCRWVHFANSRAVCVFAPDDLVPPSAAA